jgi:hypothetical protein
MNLQEQLNRIQEMMGTINEDSKKLSSIQNLINKEIDYLKTQCEEMNSESDEIISWDACNLIEVLTSVQVTDINPTDKTFIVQIIIKYKSIFQHIDEEAFIRELHYKLKKYIPNLKLEVKDSINIQDRQH